MIHHGKQLKNIRTSDGVNIFVFGDLQYREKSKAFDDEFWDQFRQEFKSTPNAWGLGLGDYEDWLRPSVRCRLQASITGDDEARKQLDDKVRRDQDDILNRMSFLEGKLIGLHSGHHEWEFSTGDNSTMRLATALKAPYLGWMASTRLSLDLNRNTPHSSSYSYTIVSMHGSGNAQSASTDAKFLENKVVPAWIADHYVRGHSCKSIYWSPFERHFIRTRAAYGEDAHRVHCLNVGGFSRAYTDGFKSDYVERAGMLPQPVSYGVIRLSFSQGREKNAKHGLVPKSNRIKSETVIRFKD